LFPQKSIDTPVRSKLGRTLDQRVEEIKSEKAVQDQLKEAFKSVNFNRAKNEVLYQDVSSRSQSIPAK